MTNGEKTEVATASRFLWVGEHPCVDFLNTLINKDGRRLDMIEDFAALLSWCAEAGLLRSEQAKESGSRWNGTAEEAAALESARHLRQVLRDMAQQVIADGEIGQSALDTVNGWLRQGVGFQEVVRAHSDGASLCGKFALHFKGKVEKPEDIVVLLCACAADLMCHTDLGTLKKCSNPACVLLFLDASKNHTRRWCSMNLCGNRSKASAHYERHRKRS